MLNMAPPLPADNLSEDIDRALMRRGHPREWSKRLRNAYADDQSARNFQETRFLLVVGLIVTMSTVLIDWVISPNIASHGLELRLTFVVPVILAGLVIGKPHRAWPATLAMCVSQIIFALVVVHLSFHMPVASANRYLMSAAIVLGLSNLLFQFRFWQLACYNIAYVAAQVTIVLLQGNGGLAGYFDYVAILLGISFGTLAISERVSRFQSRNYLLRLRYQFAADELRETNQLLQELSDRDPLTGLSNRRHFERLFAERFEDGSFDLPESVAVMMIDVDHFKAFNDRHGHQTGDRCLGAVALVLDHMVLSEGGIVARFGGEEFVAAIPYLDTQGLHDLAEQLRQAIADLPPVDRAMPDSTITASIGAVLNHSPADIELDRLISLADDALYEAKGSGRNAVVVARTAPEVLKLRA
ncbi:MAG: GGDEF domain-containing protein [Pontixanthobacter sp.]